MIPPVNIHDAKTHLSRLEEQASKGREFVIAKAGRPMVRVVPIDPDSTVRALGFLAGKGAIPADVKSGFRGDIGAMFEPAA